MKVIDNFLDEPTLWFLQDALLGDEFPWFLNKYVAQPTETDDLNDYQFTHTFFRNNKQSATYDVVKPIIDKIKPDALVRCKANLNPNTTTVKEHGFHKDVAFDCNTAVFYVNDNNGYTVFSDSGEKIESVANRLVIFPSQTLHSGSSCTNQKVRCVINFNFFGGQL
jgi:hypothetical protein